MKAIVVALLIVFLSAPIHAAPQHPKPHPQKQTSDIARPAISPDQIVINVQQPKPDPQDEAPAQKWRQREWWLFGFGVATLVINGALAFVGWRGILTANKTLKQIKKQNNIAERNLVLQFRSRIIMRNSMNSSYGADKSELLFMLVNSGSNPATLAGGKLKLSRYYQGKTETLYEESIQTLTNEPDGKPRSLSSGQYVSIQKELPKIAANTFWYQNSMSDPETMIIMLSGTITYRDEIGTYRQTGIYRRYKPSTGFFNAEDDNDLEYAD